MSLPLEYPFLPMEAKSVSTLPTGAEWSYEPKWDGFRAIIFRDSTSVRIQSKAGKPLDRYFPDIVEMIKRLAPKRFVLDGEIVIPIDGRLSFDALLLRVHPAESRVRTLVAAHRARLLVFDLLVDEHGKSLVGLPLEERRQRLQAFGKAYFHRGGDIGLTKSTRRLTTAQSWLASDEGDLDGLIAKRVDLPYRPGERNAMVKVKRQRTADCVIGGFRYASKGRLIGSLLLGLYEGELLHHVGFCSSLRADERAELTPKLERMTAPPGFTGRAPGGPSRWSTERSTAWKPLAPTLVVEIAYDHASNGRFRHGTKFVRWRPDKAPRQCTTEQIR